MCGPYSRCHADRWPGTLRQILSGHRQEGVQLGGRLVAEHSRGGRADPRHCKITRPARHEPLAAAEQARRAQSLRDPETTEDLPWGHRTLKVRGKAFRFLRREDGLSLSVKLP